MKESHKYKAVHKQFIFLLSSRRSIGKILCPHLHWNENVNDCPTSEPSYSSNDDEGMLYVKNGVYFF